MIGNPPKRFWSAARAVRDGAGYAVQLDTRMLRTPAKARLILPTEALANAIVAEWNAVDTLVDPDALPVTRAANSAIDRVTPSRDAVVEGLVAYGETDLLCYRAEEPEGLRACQAEAWDPLLDWAATDLGAPLAPSWGLMPSPQPTASVTALREVLDAFDAFALTALSDLVSISGSLVLGLAVARRRLDAEAAFELSRVDEAWQNAQWGTDAEEQLVVARRRRDMIRAEALLEMLSRPRVNVDSR